MSGKSLDLTSYQALSFDCYGTLIDWEEGISNVLLRWSEEHQLGLDSEALLLAYADNEAAVAREQPGLLYPKVLAEAFRRTGRDLNTEVSSSWANTLGDSVPLWPAFPDSAAALASLAKHYTLIIVSNVHRAGFAGSNQHLEGTFGAIITAEDVGAYKPASPHFEALDRTLADLDIRHDALLHVAQSLFHDHVPAKEHGLDSVWINRRHDRPGWGATPEPSQQWSYAAQYNSMGDFAQAVEHAFTEAPTQSGDAP